MGILSRLFGSEKVISSVMDPEVGHLAKIGQFIGNQQFTDQERAEMMKGLTTAVREFSVATANQSTVRSKITRDLAVRWITTQLALVLISVVAIFHPNPKYFELLWQIATSDVIMWGTFGVMTYFFGAYGWGAHVKGKK